MLKIVVCIKQVPAVSELPWDSKTGTLKREVAEGMINPACKHALEAALRIKNEHGARITVITMGPAMAEEGLREAAAMGADRGVLLTDRKMAGADTLITSHTLARAIEKECPDFDLVLCGCRTNDSETSQVGPQLAAELGVPGAAYIENFDLEGRTLRMRRMADDFLEIMEMELPGLATVSTTQYSPRYVPMAGIEDAFSSAVIVSLGADDLGLSHSEIGLKASPTKILNVCSPSSDKNNILMKGGVKKIVDDFLNSHADKIGGAMKKDLKTTEHCE